VGPQVGAQLRRQALLATLYSLGGMLVYLWFRFELIYGVAAVELCRWPALKDSSTASKETEAKRRAIAFATNKNLTWENASDLGGAKS